MTYVTIDSGISYLSTDSLTSLKKDLELSEVFNIEDTDFSNEFNQFTVTIEMSTLCNLKCTYCYQNGSEKRKEIEVFIKV